MESIRLTPEQQRFADLDLVPIFCIAPAGCGKTEALAARAARVVARKLVEPPRKVLAITFSNKAKSNLASRIRRTLGATWQRSVDVTNFHGFSARIIQAHGSRVGIDPDLILPDKAWYARARVAAGVGWAASNSFEQAMQQAKSGGVSDDEVWARLEETGNSYALRFESALREEGRADFNDLLRLGLRVIGSAGVGELYSDYFPLVLVDEVQDLSWDQFSLVEAVASGVATYAGDPSQGIYQFAGAETARVIAAIRSEVVETVELTTSHRSSPVVLAVVNHFGASVGSPALTCADPSAFGDWCVIAKLTTSDPISEAPVLVSKIRSAMRDHPEISTVGVICRRSSRLDPLRRLLQDEDVAYEDWTSPTHNPEVVELLYTNLDDAIAASGPEVDGIDALRELCIDSTEKEEIDLRGDIEAALVELRALMRDGLELRAAVETCKRIERSEGPVRPGIHLLNAHVGKGQEFDLVVIIGLEEGVVPDFHAEDDDAISEERRTLHVMISRARLSLVFTRSRNGLTRSGLRACGPSQWWGDLEPLATVSWN